MTRTAVSARAVGQQVERDRAAAAQKEQAEATQSELLGHVGALGALIALVGATAVIFWSSYVQWGALPSPSGGGAVLYVGVVFAIGLVTAYVVWAWLRWRDTRRGWYDDPLRLI
jgi:sterol desaturase/sphingolipid hydroxylase (fatty acid hydroxylase superfamily)